jgi:cobalt-zinc-cadmium efflux system outer membrane protein
MRPISFLAVGCACMCAQKPDILSPEDAVNRALSVHPALEANRARVDAARAQQQQASLRPNPRLYLQTENTRAGGSTPFRFAEETDNFAYASQIFEISGKRDRRADLASEMVRRRQSEMAVRQAEIARRVLSAYWSALGAERVGEVLRDSLNNLEQSVQYHRIRVEEGALAEADLIRIELERGQVAVAFQNAEQDARRLRLELFREMGEIPNAHVSLTGRLEDVRPFVTSPVEEALQQRTDVQLGRQMVQEAKAAVLLEQANAKPDPEVLFGYKRATGHNAMIAGVQIALPFWNRNQGSIASSAANERAAEFELRSVLHVARNEIETAQSDFDQKFRLLTETLPKMRSHAADTIAIARAVYREGAGDLLRLLDAERTSLQAELLFTRTLIEYRLALVRLQAVAGILP